jgi:hypothetical protein
MRAIAAVAGGVIAGAGLAWRLIGIPAAVSVSARNAWPGVATQGTVFTGFVIMGLGVGLMVVAAA